MDGMLGSSARWLRMLGHETEYDPAVDDDALLQQSRSKNAILLTKDEALQRRASKLDIRSVLLVGQTEPERLALLAKALGVSLAINMTLTRCPVCGSEIHEISITEASELVPAASVKKYDRFWKCDRQSCGKAYWIGSHWRKIKQTLDQALAIASKE